MTALSQQALEGVRRIKPYQPGKPVEELERELGLTDIIKLASNENPLGPGQAARAALSAPLSQLERYPDGNGFALRSALAAHHDVGPERIVLGNGSNDVLELIARAFLTRGRRSVFSEHAFAVYPLASQAVGAELCGVPANPAAHPEQPFGHDLDAMAEAVNEHAAVVFIANPNNPTGTWVEPAVLETFLQRVPAHVAVVLDEAYNEYMAPELRPATSKLLDQYDNLIVTRTFSKVYGLAALRAGYALAHPDVADLLNRIRQPFNVNALAQAAAIAALGDTRHVERSVALNNEGLRQLRAGLTAMGLGFLPSQANFVTVDCARPAGPLFDALLRKGVILRPLAGYGMPNHLRITVGTKDENQRCLDALGEVLDIAGAAA